MHQEKKVSLNKIDFSKKKLEKTEVVKCFNAAWEDICDVQSCNTSPSLTFSTETATTPPLKKTRTIIPDNKTFLIKAYEFFTCFKKAVDLSPNHYKGIVEDNFKLKLRALMQFYGIFKQDLLNKGTITILEYRKLTERFDEMCNFCNGNHYYFASENPTALGNTGTRTSKFLTFGSIMTKGNPNYLNPTLIEEIFSSKTISSFLAVKEELNNIERTLTVPLRVTPQHLNFNLGTLAFKINNYFTIGDAAFDSEVFINEFKAYLDVLNHALLQIQSDDAHMELMDSVAICESFFIGLYHCLESCLPEKNHPYTEKSALAHRIINECIVSSRICPEIFKCINDHFHPVSASDGAGSSSGIQFDKLYENFKTLSQRFKAVLDADTERKQQEMERELLARQETKALADIRNREQLERRMEAQKRYMLLLDKNSQPAASMQAEPLVESKAWQIRFNALCNQAAVAKPAERDALYDEAARLATAHDDHELSMQAIVWQIAAVGFDHFRRILDTTSQIKNALRIYIDDPSSYAKKPLPYSKEVICLIRWHHNNTFNLIPMITQLEQCFHQIDGLLKKLKDAEIVVSQLPISQRDKFLVMLGKLQLNAITNLRQLSDTYRLVNEHHRDQSIEYFDFKKNSPEVIPKNPDKGILKAHKKHTLEIAKDIDQLIHAEPHLVIIETVIHRLTSEGIIDDKLEEACQTLMFNVLQQCEQQNIYLAQYVLIEFFMNKFTPAYFSSLKGDKFTEMLQESMTPQVDVLLDPKLRHLDDLRDFRFQQDLSHSMLDHFARVRSFSKTERLFQLDMKAQTPNINRCNTPVKHDYRLFSLSSVVHRKELVPSLVKLLNSISEEADTSRRRCLLREPCVPTGYSKADFAFFRPTQVPHQRVIVSEQEQEQCAL